MLSQRSRKMTELKGQLKNLVYAKIMWATMTSIYFGNYIITQSDYFIDLYYNSKALHPSGPKMIRSASTIDGSLDSLVKEINHPLKRGHHFNFQDYLHWLDHTNDPHLAKTTTNTFIVVYVIVGVILSAICKIIGLWILLYCINGA